MNGNKYKILIIEDDEHINNLVATLLEANGYQTLSAYSCEDGMMMYASHRPDLVVLDLGLPDQDGMTFLKRLRKDSLTPVIVLSARSDEKDKVEALDMGANDYVTKPFGSNEFLARIRSTLRMTTHRMQNGMFPGGKFKASGLTIDYDARRVFLHKKEVKLTQTEYNIIAALSEHAGKCNLLEYLTQRDIQTKNSGVNVRYRGKHRFFKGFNEFIKEKTRRCDNDFEKIERHVFF